MFTYRLVRAHRKADILQQICLLEGVSLWATIDKVKLWDIVAMEVALSKDVAIDHGVVSG